MTRLVALAAVVILCAMMFSPYILIVAIIAAIIANGVQIAKSKRCYADKNCMAGKPGIMQTVTHSWGFALVLGVVSNAILFGAYPYFLPLILLVSPFFGLQAFLKEGVSSLPKIRWNAAFLLGAALGWTSIYFLYLKK